MVHKNYQGIEFVLTYFANTIRETWKWQIHNHSLDSRYFENLVSFHSLKIWWSATGIWMIPWVWLKFNWEIHLGDVYTAPTGILVGIIWTLNTQGVRVINMAFYEHWIEYPFTIIGLPGRIWRIGRVLCEELANLDLLGGVKRAANLQITSRI